MSRRRPRSRPTRPDPATALAAGPAATGGGRPRRSFLWRWRRFFFLALLVVTLLVSGLAFVVWQIPLPSSDPPLAQTTFVCSAEITGDCSATNSIAQLSAGVNRVNVTYEQIPAVLIQAVLAAEDRDFFQHNGIDPSGIARAFYADLRSDSGLRQGGSTITQQYVKNVYLTSEQTLQRKVTEAVMATKLEKQLTKQEILGRYLNTIYFGRGAYGVEAAARAYFGKDIQQLGLPEASYLAGIIRAPEAADANRPATDPLAATNRDAATNRRHQVLDAMLAAGYITPAQHAQVDALGWDYVLPRQQANSFGNVRHTELGSEYFIEYVRDWLSQEGHFSDAQIFGGGLRVYTTIDWSLQQAAYDSVNKVLDQPGDPAASLVAIDPGGNVRAMVGGKDFQTSQVNLAVGAEGGGGGRQPGSAFKPFALAEAIKQNIPLDKTYNAPSSLSLKLKDGDTWRVSNYGDAGYGALNLVDATRVSSNTAYAQLINDVGVDNVVALAHRMGITGDLPKVPSVVLGTGSVSVLDMASAYSTFAGGGNHVGPFVVSKVTTADGRVLYQANTTPDRVLDKQVSDSTSWVLSRVVENGTGTGARFGQPAAGKTGTTEHYRDAWFAGFTCQLTAAVWLGYPGPDTKYMDQVHGQSVAGGTFPTDIWREFMTRAHQGKPACPPFDAPRAAPAVAAPAPAGPPAPSTAAPRPFPSLTTAPPSTRPPASTTSTTARSATSTTAPSGPSSSTSSPPASSSTTAAAPPSSAR